VPKAALLVVDVQNDFLPGGALPVPEGDSIIPPLNEVISAFTSAGLPIFFTRDWHPPNHCSFRDRGGVWPPHCVQGTRGAELSQRIHRPAGSVVISKGDRPDEEAFSGFQGTDLAARLRSLGVREVCVGGLATEYCVKTTTEDALREGFAVGVMLDCVKGLEVHPGDSAAAIYAMKTAGAVAVQSLELVPKLVGTQQ
jgi:nicotinamidase/pyrazinamidase